jgi:hypothetical protein
MPTISQPVQFAISIMKSEASCVNIGSTGQVTILCGCCEENASFIDGAVIVSVGVEDPVPITAKSP